LGNVNFVGGNIVLASIGNIVTWEYVGYNMIILYVVLRSSPRDPIDAAVLDGPKLWDLVSYVKIPMARIGLFLTAILSLIGTLQLFTEPEILSSFSTAVNTSYTPNIYIYTVAFTNNNLNYAAALSVLVGVITVVATAVFLGLNRLRQRRAGIS
ncbi:MAG: ABC transporter permease subunit, partial [Actinomycetota bacterium]|nr:ABC transporter permease subunit [Actinomycetota bacterium]